MLKKNPISMVLILAAVAALLAAAPVFKAGPREARALTRMQDNTGAFKEYWYRGKAEITRFRLEQSRYGEVHEGDAVLIYVTEDFLRDKQVKHEFGDPKDAVSVLKLNFTRKFNTGIYPYSMMTSTFTPIERGRFPGTLKTTTTSQEWCGHTFHQLNSHKGGYRVQVRSYFQGEGDQDYTIKDALLEDEVWTLLRIDPAMLPTGDVELVPGSQFLRLKHLPLKPYKASASSKAVMDTALSREKLVSYTIDYKDIERSLTITYESTAPFRIVAWEERGESGFGSSAVVLTTRATRTHEMLSDYWNKNGTGDTALRRELGLE